MDMAVILNLITLLLATILLPEVAHADPVTLMVGIGTALGATAGTAAVVGTVATIGATALTANAFMSQKREAKKSAAAAAEQNRNQMAAMQQQQENTQKQLNAVEQIKQQVPTSTSTAGRQTRRRLSSGKTTDTILTPLGNQQAKTTLGGY